MSKINPNPPPFPNPDVPKKGEPHFKGGFVEAQPLNWLGMTFTGKEAQKLWMSIIQTISNQIKKDQDRAVKELKKDWGDGDGS